MEHLRRNDTKDFLWTLGPDGTHQITQSEHRTDMDNIKIEKLIILYNRYYLPKKNKYNSRDFCWAKQTDTETPTDHWEKLIELEKERDFPDFSTELLISKFITINHRQKITGQTAERKGLRCTKSSQIDTPKHIGLKEQEEYHTGSPNIKPGKKTSIKSPYTE